MMKIFIRSSLLLAALVSAGCGAGKNKANVEVFQDMMDQRNFKSQDYDTYFKRGSNLVPPDGTVPRGFTPYAFAGDPLGAEEKLVNPFAGQVTAEVLERGKAKYDVYCGLCHGVGGQGDGQIAQYLALRPPPLVSDKVKNFKDGRIYHIITDGQGVMSTYATQITKPEDRWAVVAYVRELQKGK